MKIKLLLFTMLFSAVSWGQIYQHGFGTTGISAHPYTVAPGTFDTNLSSSSWSNSTGAWTSFAGSAGQAIALNNSGGTPTITLTFNVAAGFQVSVTQFNFWRQRSASGAQNWSMTINGIAVGSGTVPTTGAAIGNTNVSNAVSNLTGTVTVVMSLSAASGTGTFRLDDFTLIGSVTATTPQPEINVQGTGANTIADNDTTPSITDGTNFGTSVTISSSTTTTFTIQNTGSAPLTLSGASPYIVISGANASDFTVTTIPSNSIAATSGSTTFVVTFTPSAIGLRTATITINNNDSNEGVYNFDIQGTGVCPAVTIASIFPTSGPAGTEVIINASSGSLLGSTVDFNGTAATIISSSASQLVVTVPAGATTGAINITKTTTGCVTSTPTFTVINNDITSCQGAAISDLIIYDIHDEKTGSGGFITLYNGTAAAVNLTNYTLWRTTNHDDGSEIDYANLTGTIASGALGILKVSVGSCGPASTNGTINGGFNENDGIQLRNAAGTVVIDDVDTYPTGPGYYMVRNTGALSARTSYVAGDWSTTPLIAGQCYPSAGLTLPTGGSQPSISVQPTIALTCASTTASMSVSATEGFVGGNALAYQWYVVAPATTTWTALTNTGVYTGTTSAILNISSLTGLDGYQYYCQVRENTATCYIATVAVKINTGATVWNGTVWSNGVPTLSKAATINGNYTTGTNGSFSACNLTINATFTLTVSANTYVEIQNNITNNGTFNVLNNGSLVQINDAGVNTGNISYERIASVKLQDYVYWSSPVTGFDVNSISPLTPAYYHWLWNPTIANTNAGLGNWQNASTTMIAGQGYIVRAPNGFSNSVSQNWTATFNNGVPFNGIFTPAIARGSYTGSNYIGTNGATITANDDNWNLLGNPYPSAISINSFLTANPQLDGFVRLWTHGTLPVSAVNPFYTSFVYNYTTGDYVAINGVGATSGPGVLSVIGGGQGFFTLMLPGGATTSTATFNNAMRNKTFANSQFYKAGNHNTATVQEVGGNIERNRIWIDLVSPTMETTRTLVAYVEGATLGKDRMFDALTDYKSSQNFYSLIGNDIMTIQGRSLPFDVNDKVPMGIKIPTNGTYTIAIATVDGLFSGKSQKIYIEDKLLGTITDITEIPYQFTATQGIINDRFVLRYTNQALSNADYTVLENNVTVVASNNEIKINSSLENIKDYTVYNVLGQTLSERNNVNTNQSVVSSIQKNNQALFVKVTLTNSQTVVKKIVF
jgi:hypothetical protein